MLKAKDNGDNTCTCPYCGDLYEKHEISTDTIACSTCQKIFIVPDFF